MPAKLHLTLDKTTYSVQFHVITLFLTITALKLPLLSSLPLQSIQDYHFLSFKNLHTQ